MFQGRLAWDNHLSIRAPIVVDHQLKRRSRWQGAVVFGVLLPLALLEYKLPPFRRSGRAGPECHGRLAWSFAPLVARMILGNPAQL